MPYDVAIPASAENTSRQASKISIAHRFRGPIASGNGGYVCGLTASPLDGAVEATLFAPPPLESPMVLRTDGVEASLYAADNLVAKSRRATLDLNAPGAVSLHAALDASERFDGRRFHPHPECFVCGTNRSDLDGLRIFAGPLAEDKCVASAWLPSSRDSDGDGRIRPEIIWAALDCPGYFALGEPGLDALLGRMTAEIFKRPLANDPCVVIGWKIGREGRKNFAGSALYSLDGALLAHARTVWIELKPKA